MPGTVASLASLLAWPEWVPVVAVVIAVVAASQLVLPRSVWRAASLPVKAIATVAFVAAIFWMIAMMFAPRLTILALRGEPVVARVVHHDATHYPGRGGGHDVHCYNLQRIDGRPIFGNVCRDWPDEFTVGETVTVLVDPSNLIAPETPDEVATAGFWQIFGLASFVATFALCWVAGGLTARPPSSRQPRGRHSL